MGSAVDTASATGATAAGGEQRFLKLLVTQLNNQDPLNPMDNAQLTSQLAQMSTVSGIEKLNTAVQSLIAQGGSGQVLQAASMIGRNVLAPGSEITLQPGTPAAFAVEPASDADAVGVDILDGAGRLVRHMDLGPVPAGVRQLTWDGLDDQGQAAAAGNYTVNVTAAQAGAPVAADALVFQRVQSVAQGTGGITLDTGGRTTPLSAVRLIR
jgi:flagellar basal-body rod modification protein FlgD